MPQLDKKYQINAGSYIHPLTFERLTSNGIDELGNPNQTWDVLFKTRCSISNNTGNETMKQEVTEYETVTKKMYFRTNRRVKLTSKDRVFYDGEYWNIKSAYDYDDKGIITLVIAYKTV